MGDLTTTAAAKAWLAITGTADDTLLERLVSAVSAAAQSRMNRQITAAPYQETRNGTGKSVLMLANGPVTAVASVTIDGAVIPARTSPTGTGYFCDGQLLYVAGASFTKGVQNIVITYTAGYATTPADLEQAVLEIVAFKYRQKSRIGESSKILNGETVAFFRDVDPDSLRVLDQYQRVLAP